MKGLLNIDRAECFIPWANKTTATPTPSFAMRRQYASQLTPEQIKGRFGSITIFVFSTSKLNANKKQTSKI
jgi:hypothetical protein